MKLNYTKTLSALFAVAFGLAIAAPADAQLYDHLKCFKAKDVKTFSKATADLNVLGGHFAALQNCTISAGAKEYCIPVDKMNVVVTEGAEDLLEGQDQDYGRLCYKVKCPAIAVGAQAYLDQFGGRTLDGFKVATICTPAVIGPVPTEFPPTWGATPQDYVAGPSSYLNTLAVPTVATQACSPNVPCTQNSQCGTIGTGTCSAGSCQCEVPTCCYDFGARSKDNIEDGTVQPDNALAILAEQLTQLGIDVQSTLDDAIQNGELVLLLDHPGLNVVTQPDQFTIVQLLGEFEGATDYTAANSGAGTFNALEASFVPGTGEPLNWYTPAQMGTTDMNAGPFKLTLSLPFGFLTLNVTAAEARASADHGAITVAGVPYTNGKLSGYVLMDELFQQINAVLNSPTCDCLNLTEDVYQKPAGEQWTSDGHCVGNADTLCTLPSEEVCVTLAGTDLLGSPPQVCLLLPGVLQQQADIDLNGDTVEDPVNNPNKELYEAMSVGLQFTAVNGQIVGVTP